MLRPRVIPALLLRHESLVKTVNFGRFAYVGDPCNTVRIFNELEVDELLFLDIMATREGTGPNLKVLADIANECFMPLGYGGGLRTLDQAKAVFDIGFEKVSINTAAIDHPDLISDVARVYGSQAVIASVDVKAGPLGRASVRVEAGHRNTHLDPVDWSRQLEQRGAGEILLTCIDREGTWQGFDLHLIKQVTDAVHVPVIAHGGAGSVQDIEKVIKQGGASAAAVGSLVVFQKKGNGVLVNFPSPEQLEQVLS